jgi:hypothetical protein
MKSAFFAVLFLGLSQVVNAAPIQAVVDAKTGSSNVNGLTGEIYISLGGPDTSLNRAAAAPISGSTLDNFTPGEVTYLNLGGFQGSAAMGNIVQTNLSTSQLQALRFHTQATFTSEIVELTPQIVTSAPAAGTAGFFIVQQVPEPATLGLAGLSLLGLAFRRRIFA